MQFWPITTSAIVFFSMDFCWKSHLKRLPIVKLRGTDLANSRKHHWHEDLSLFSKNKINRIHEYRIELKKHKIITNLYSDVCYGIITFLKKTWFFTFYACVRDFITSPKVVLKIIRKCQKCPKNTEIEDSTVCRGAVFRNLGQVRNASIFRNFSETKII